MPSSIPGSDTESGGASVAPRPSPPLGEARAKPALESGPAHPLAPTLRAVGRFARRKPLGALGALIVVALLVMAAFAERIAPYGYDDTIRGARMKAPSAAHWLGTDNLSRDMWSRVVYGARVSITVGLLTVALATVLASAVGVPPPHPSWGGMLSGSGRTYMFRAPWMAIWPGVAISLAVFGFNMLGDALRDVLDPRLRGS